MKKFWICLLTLFGLSSCSSTIKNFDKYQSVQISKTKYMPKKEEAENNKMLIAVVDFDDSNLNMAKYLNMGKIAADEIEKILIKNRNISILDRKSVKNLEKEIRLANLENTDISGLKGADYIITGSFSRADVSKVYKSNLMGNVAAGVVTNIVGCDGNKNCQTGKNVANALNVASAIVNPGYWLYTGEVSGNIKIYRASDLSVLEILSFHGKQDKNEDISLLAGENNNRNGNNEAVLREAFLRAIYSRISSIQNIFTKKGYILEKRNLDKKNIFRISLGMDDNIHMDDKFIIYKIVDNYNPITDKNIPTEIKLTSGVISNLITKNDAWVIIDDNKAVDKIQIGNIVRIIH